MLRTIAFGPGCLLSFVGRNGAFVAFFALVLGISVPSLAPQLKLWLPYATGIAAFGAFLSASFSVERNWLQSHVVLIIIWVLAAPVLIMGSASQLAGVPPELLTGIVLAFVAPPSSGVPSFANLLHLSPKMALITFTCVSAAAPFTVPALALLFGIELQLDRIQFGLKLLAMIGGGGLCALLVKSSLKYFRWLFPGPQASTGTSALGLAVLYVASGGVVRQQFDHGGMAASLILVLAVGYYLLMALIGCIVFVWLGRKDALTVGLLSGNRNVTLAWAAAAQQMPATAEAYIASASMLNALMPMVLQQAAAFSERIRKRRAQTTVEVSWYEIERPNIAQSAMLEPGLTYTIGRGIDCDIRLTTAGASRLHAKVSVSRAGELSIRDLGSKNGVYLNGVHVAATSVTASDVVQIADYILRIGPSPSIVCFAVWHDPDDIEADRHSLGLEPGRYRIGRGADNEIRLQSDTVSRHHAEIVIDESGEGTLIDLGSTNGLKQDGVRLGTVRLDANSIVEIGNIHFSLKVAAPTSASKTASATQETVFMPAVRRS